MVYRSTLPRSAVSASRVAALVPALAKLAREMLGRSFWLANTVIVVISVALAVTLYIDGVPAVVVSGADLGPLFVGAASGTMSLALNPGALRFVGIGGFAAAIAAVCVPLVVGAIQREEAAAAAEEAELQRHMASSVRPYTVPGLVLRSASFSSESSQLNLSSDPDSQPDDDFFADPGDVTVLTSRLWTQDEIAEQACSAALNPVAGGSPTNSCEPVADATWLLEMNGIAEVVRIIGDRKVTLSGASAAELENLAMSVRLLGRGTFERHFRIMQERAPTS